MSDFEFVTNQDCTTLFRPVWLRGSKPYPRPSTASSTAATTTTATASSWSTAATATPPWTATTTTTVPYFHSKLLAGGRLKPQSPEVVCQSAAATIKICLH